MHTILYIGKTNIYVQKKLYKNTMFLFEWEKESRV